MVGEGEEGFGAYAGDGDDLEGFETVGVEASEKCCQVFVNLISGPVGC
jgi:hypothetical protein